MEEFNTHSEHPFLLKEGNTVEISTYNRIAATNRINYLVRQVIPDFDIREKTDDYRKALDLEMVKLYYRDDMTKKIDEDFCQNMSRICVSFEQTSYNPVVSDNELSSVIEEINHPVEQKKEGSLKHLLKKWKLIK